LYISDNETQEDGIAEEKRGAPEPEISSVTSLVYY
jgi:hypothetical protein